MLESLEREYKRDEDFCSSEKATAAEDKVAYMQQLITKMLEQKEAFLKVNTPHCVTDNKLRPQIWVT